MTYRGASPSGFGLLVLDTGCRPRPLGFKPTRSRLNTRSLRRNIQTQDPQQTNKNLTRQRTQTHRIH